MQLFHLFSFVVVASYAAALPQPAGLSEKYSNNVDTNLVSGLEARSYQPVLNSYKESATLMSLERRANSGSDSSPPPVTAPENRFMDDFDGRDIFDMGIFSEVLASTISEVGDGSTGVFKKGELAIQKIGGDAGDLVAKYIRREAYVNVALLLWSYFQIATVLSTIKSGLGDGQYSKIEPNLVAKIVELKNTLEAGLNAAVDATTKILNEEGTVIENVEKISTSFYSANIGTNPDPVQCNTLRDEWSRLKAAATQLERADGRKQWVKHADNLDRAVSDGRTNLVFAVARAMSGNSFRSAAVTPLYKLQWHSTVRPNLDPACHARCHYGSLAADTTGHSLDLQYWHDRQPIQVFLNTPLIRNSDILDQDFSWNQIVAALLQMSPRKSTWRRWYKPLRSTKRHSTCLPTPKKASHQPHLLVLC
ncbi:hypothetical protein BASA81_013387 [Batrachochytrium salamandrivorans]|nr:hypothetical protein BASA81_013387 [Batrachochytrium salamandrivorans]